MGGYGSGRDGWKPKAEEAKRIDVRYMRKRGFLNDGCQFTLSWSRGEESVGYINARTTDRTVILNYRVKPYWEDEWTDIEECVPIEWTPCNFGGQRPWLNCPRCSRRVEVLYGVGKRFLCRHCYNVTYSSQCETVMDRLLRRSRKMRRRLDVDESIFESVVFKPKGMHQKTFDRLRKELDEIEDRLMHHTWLAAFKKKVKVL